MRGGGGGGVRHSSGELCQYLEFSNLGDKTLKTSCQCHFIQDDPPKKKSQANNKTKTTPWNLAIGRKKRNYLLNTFYLVICRGTDFPRSRNRGQKRGKAYLKRNSRFSAKTLLVTFKKHTLLSKRTFQRHFENRNSRYLTTLIFVIVTPN